MKLEENKNLNLDEYKLKTESNTNKNNNSKINIKDSIGFKNAEMEEINFCVDPFGDSSKYQNVRIEAGAHNSAAVRIIPLDSDDNKCNKS